MLIITLKANLITPIPDTIDYNKEKVLLGKDLFFDNRFSKDNTVSCASCCLLKEGGDDNFRVSIGVGGKIGKRNAPTVFNSRYNKMQFWDAGVDTLTEQIFGPIHNQVVGVLYLKIIIYLNFSTKNKFFNLKLR